MLPAWARAIEHRYRQRGQDDRHTRRQRERAAVSGVIRRDLAQYRRSRTRRLRSPTAPLNPVGRQGWSARAGPPRPVVALNVLRSSRLLSIARKTGALMPLTEGETSYSVEVALLRNPVTGGRIGDGGDAAVPPASAGEHDEVTCSGRRLRTGTAERSLALGGGAVLHAVAGPRFGDQDAAG
jgi:hypothetical protein